MILTEEEAKTKRCQESILPATSLNLAGGNKPVFQYAPVDCIGSACMAWRWSEGATDPEYEYTTTKEGLPTHGEGWEHVPPKFGDVRLIFRRVDKPAMPARGYCGKAGKP